LVGITVLLDRVWKALFTGTCSIGFYQLFSDTKPALQLSGKMQQRLGRGSFNADAFAMELISISASRLHCRADDG